MDTTTRNMTRALRANPNDAELLLAFDAGADRLGLDLATRVEALLAADATAHAQATVKAARAVVVDSIRAARAADKANDAPCATCGGRGSVVTWDTLDSIHSDCYASYATCTTCNGRRGPLDMTTWSRRYDAGHLRTADVLSTLRPGWTVDGIGLFLSPDDAADLAVFDALLSDIDVAERAVRDLLRPAKGSRVVLVKGRPKRKDGTILAKGARGTLRWESRDDDRVGFLLDGTEEMVFTTRGNLQVESLGEERDRRAAATIERAAKLAEVKERDLFVGAIVRGPDGKVGEVFWLKETRLGYRWGKGKEDVTWSNADQVERAGVDASRDFRAANPIRPRRKARR